MGKHGPAGALARVWKTRHSVWSLIAVIATASVVLWTSLVAPLEAVDDAIPVPWFLLAIAFAVVESFVVNLHFRSESGSFSLLEIPLVFGLIYTRPSLLWVAIVVGSALSLTIVRRQPLVKIAFNVANLSLHVAVAAVLYSWFLGDQDPLSPLGWIALLGASLLSSLAEVLGINLVIGITEKQFEIHRAWNMVVFGWLVAGANTIQALIAVLLVAVEPFASVLLVGSTGMLFIAYRAYVSERDNRERVEFLYNSTRSLRESAETHSAVSVLLEEAASMFRAGKAQLVLFSAPGADETTLVYDFRDGRTRRRQIDEDAKEALDEIVALAGDPFIVVEGTAPAIVRRHLDALGIRDAMVGSLASDQRSVGLLIVGDRLGSVMTFTQEDLRLFENLVDQSSVALENDQLEQALARLRELETELSRQARYDLLTGLANRNLFTGRLDEQLETAKPDEITLLYVDLDDFKLVNDRLGHAAGDALLVEVAQRVVEIIRPTDLAARLGGDEFIVMLVGQSEPEAIAHRIIGTLGAPFLLGPDEVRIGASVGIATFSADCSAAELLHQADLAMYSAKQRGKGSVVWFSDDLQSDQSRQQALQTALRRGIADREFEVVYQPVVRLADLGIVGAEALVRWRHGDGAPLAPAEFIAEAERSGLVMSIDRLVREVVLGQLRELVDAASSEFFVAVNISARNLQQTEFVDQVASDVLAREAPATSLVLEVTESAFAGDPKAASRVLQNLRELGIRIALDDFGTGYSSLSYLRELPIDFLKIAQPFISDLSRENGSSFVDAITGLGRTLGLTVIAEGVERNDQLSALQDIRCDLGQGYLFARPMPSSDLLDLLREPESIRHAIGRASQV